MFFGCYGNTSGKSILISSLIDCPISTILSVLYLNASSCLASWSSSNTAAMRMTLGSALSTNAAAAKSNNTDVSAIAKQQPVGRVLLSNSWLSLSVVNFQH